MNATLSEAQLKKAIGKYKPKIIFGNSVDTVTLHAFLSFIDQNQTRDMNYVRTHFDLDGVNWRKLIENSKKKGLPLGPKPGEVRDP